MPFAYPSVYKNTTQTFEHACDTSLTKSELKINTTNPKQQPLYSLISTNLFLLEKNKKEEGLENSLTLYLIQQQAVKVKAWGITTPLITKCSAYR